MIAGTLELQLMANMARLQADMDAAKKTVGGAMAEIERVVGLAKTALVAFAGVASVGAFASMVRGSIEAAAGMHDLSIQTGASVAALQAFKGIAATTPTSIDAIAGAMGKLAKNMAVASEESKGVGQAVKAIGLDFTVLKGLKPEDQMLAIAKALDQFENGAGKSAVAMTLFGKEGAKMLPFLQDLAQEADKVTEKLTAQEVQVRASQAAMADDFTDNLKKIKKESEAWKKDLSMGMLPALYEFTQAFRDVTTGAGGVKESISKLSKDGTITEWTRSAIYGVTYVMDAFEGLKAVVSSVGNYLGAQAAMIVEQFSLAWKVVSGLFKSGSVMDEISASMARQRAIAAGLAENLDQTWGTQTFGSKLRARMDELNGVAAAGQRVGKALNFDANGGGSTAAIDRELEKQAKLLGELAGLTASFGEDWARLNTIFAAGKLTVEQLTAAQAALLAKQPAIQAAVKLLQAEYEEFLKTEQELAAAEVADSKAREAGRKVIGDYAKAIDDQNELTQIELGLIGSTSAAREIALGQYRVELELKKQIEAIDANSGFDEAQRVAERARVAESAAKAMAGVQARVYVDEFKKTNDAINSGLTDALMRGFESGKGFLRNLRDTAVNMFQTMVLRPGISAVINPVSQGINSFLYGNGQQGAGGTSGLIGNGLGAYAANNMGALGSTVSGWFGGGSAAAATTAGVVPGGTGVIGAIGNNASAYVAGTETASTAAGSSVLTAIPVWGWIALAAIAIASQAKGETRSGGQYAYDSNAGVASLLQGPSGGEIQGDLVKQSIAGTVGGINGLLKGMGSQTTIVSAQAGVESSDRGRGGVFFGGTDSTGKTYGESGKGSNYEGTLYEQTSSHSVDAKTALENFTTDLMQGTIQALQAATDIPKTIADQLKGVDAESLSKDAATALVTAIQTTVSGVTLLHDALATMGLKELSFDAAAGLIKVAGGMDKLGAGLSTYYDQFYTDAEKSANTVKNVTKVFDDLGIPMLDLSAGADSVRKSFRALVDGAMADTSEQGQKTAVALLNVSGSLGGLIQGATSASSEAVSRLAEINRGWQDKLDLITGAQTDRGIALRDATDESTRALMRQVYAQEDLKTATEQAAEALTKVAASRLDGATQGAADAYAGLTRAVEAQRAADVAAAEAQRAIATAAFTSQSEIYRGQIDSTKASLDAVNTSVGKLKSLSGSLKSTLDGLRIAGSDGAYRADAQAQIRAALATAQRGGGLPLDGRLESALSTISKPSEDLFGSFSDYARDFYRTANDIASLSTLTDSQLSTEEITKGLLETQGKTLEDQKKLLKNGFDAQTSALDDILRNAQQQLDAASGINTSVLSVADALKAFQSSVATLEGTRATQGLATTPGVADNRAQLIRDFMDQLRANTSLTDIDRAHVLSTRAHIEGVSEAEIASAGGYTKEEARAWFAKAGIPQFEVGTNYVPRDMLAQIHEGEAIVPRAYNPAAGGGDSKNAEIAAALRAMADRLDRIEANTRATAGHTAGTDRKLARVIPGNALVTEPAA